MAGGLAVLLLGWLFAHVRTGAALIADYLTRKVVVSGSFPPPAALRAPRTRTTTHHSRHHCAPLSLLPVEVTQREEAFDWILQWLAQQPKSSFASHNYRHACSTLSVCVACRVNTTRALCVRILCVWCSLVVHQSLGPMQRFRRQQKLEVVSKSPPQLKCVQVMVLWCLGGSDSA